MGSEDGTRTREGYCSYCDEAVTLRVTVPWQDDICTECGNSVSTGSSA